MVALSPVRLSAIKQVTSSVPVTVTTAVEPPAPTVLQKLVDEKDGHVVSVGKIADIYANCGITKK